MTDRGRSSAANPPGRKAETQEGLLGFIYLGGVQDVKDVTEHCVKTKNSSFNILSNRKVPKKCSFKALKNKKKYQKAKNSKDLKQ